MPVVICALIVGGILGAIAYGTTNPSTFGHSAGEVEVDTDDDGVPDTDLQQLIEDGGLIGGSGPVVFSSEMNCYNDNDDSWKVCTFPDQSWTSCFLTDFSVTRQSGTVDKECTIVKKSPNWVLEVYAGANERVNCSMKCYR